MSSIQLVSSLPHHSGSNLKVILQDLTEHMQNIAFGLCFSLLKKVDLECEEI